MHIADYTKIFTTPDELVDFLMLEVKEQDRILAELAQVGRIGGVTMCCWVENANRSGCLRRFDSPNRKMRSIFRAGKLWV